MDGVGAAAHRQLRQQLSEERSVPLSRHIVARLRLSRHGGLRVPSTFLQFALDGPMEPSNLDVVQLRERSLRSGGRLIAIAKRFETGDRYPVEWDDGNTYSIPAEIYLAQAITHATEHRSQVATILTQQGIEPPTSASGPGATT